MDATLDMQSTEATALFASAAEYLMAQQFTDAGRATRGLNLAQQPGAVRYDAATLTWRVRSECGHRCYVVNTGAGTCECVDAERHGNGPAFRCKHNIATLAYSMVYDELRFRALNARALAATRQPCRSQAAGVAA